jgi:hypothetical protein
MAISFCRPIDRQHASIYKWELEVSNRWGGFNRASILKMYNKYKIHSGWEGYNHKRFFNLPIPWID